MLCSPSRNVCHSEGELIRTSITLPSSRGFLTLNLILTYWGTKASLVSQLVRIHLQCRRPQFDSWVRKIPWWRDRLPTPVFLGFPVESVGKESACNVGDLDSISSWEHPLEEDMGAHTSVLAWRISMDRGAWQASVHGVAKSHTSLSDYAHWGTNNHMLKFGFSMEPALR